MELFLGTTLLQELKILEEESGKVADVLEKREGVFLIRLRESDKHWLMPTDSSRRSG